MNKLWRSVLTSYNSQPVSFSYNNREVSMVNFIFVGKAFEIRKSIELLIMKEGCEWFYKNFVNPHLQRTANKYTSKGPNCGYTSLYVCNMLRISGKT